MFERSLELEPKYCMTYEGAQPWIERAKRKSWLIEGLVAGGSSREQTIHVGVIAQRPQDRERPTEQGHRDLVGAKLVARPGDLQQDVRDVGMSGAGVLFEQRVFGTECSRHTLPLAPPAW